MPVFETFAQRKRMQARASQPDVYVYDEVPPHLRHQICLALAEGIGRYHDFTGNEFHTPPNANDFWEHIDRICRKELPSYLSHTTERNLAVRFFNYVQRVQEIDDLLSGIEVGCALLSIIDDSYPNALHERSAVMTAANALEEINLRFTQHSVGYQFEGRQLVRIDSKLTHAEVIKPALSLLTAPIFAKAEKEFQTAYRHYRTGEYKDCVTAANRAYESMLKAICEAKGWEYGKGDRASDLITKVNNGGLFTHDFDQSFNAFIAMLKAGLPAVRNNAGGHGESPASAAVSIQIARFALNLTATNMVFLAESYEAIKER